MTKLPIINPGDIKAFPYGKAPEISNNLFSEYSRVDRNRLFRVCLFIEDHCSDFLNILKKTNMFLYRGIKDCGNNQIFLGYSRNDRTPRDTDAYIQTLTDTYLKLQGFTALRSNSIFCTADESATDIYGRQYIIFPINGFKYTWSLVHEDWTITEYNLSPNYEKLGNIFFNIFHGRDRNPFNSDPFQSMVNVYEKSFGWRKNNYITSITYLKTFMDNVQELSITNTAVNDYFTPKLTKNINRLIFEILDPNIASAKFVKFNKLLDTRLDTAIKLQNEVMICGSYVAIDAKKFEQGLKEYFLKATIQKRPIAATYEF